MNQEEITTLAQLVEAMDDARKKMEEYYNKRDIENFEKAKKQVVEFKQKIEGILK